MLNAVLDMRMIASPKLACDSEKPDALITDLQCLDNLEYLKQFDDQSIHLVVTSPPYNLGKSYEKRASIESYVASQEAVIRECCRLLLPTGSLCWQVGNYVSKGEIVPLDILLFPTFKKFGLHLRNRIVWRFEHGLHGAKRLSGRYETVLWFSRGGNYTFNLDSIRVPAKYPNKRHYKGPRFGQLSSNPLGKNPGDVWDIPNVKNNHVEKTIHPCQFPVELAERLVLGLSNPGDWVLDPYMGVGSTVVAAAKHGRSGFGCDVNQEYVTVAKQRIKQLSAGILPLRPMGKPIYEPK